MNQPIDGIAEGQKFLGVLAELCIVPKTSRLRLRTLPGQVFPSGVFVECSKQVRSAHSMGTVFKINVGVSRKPAGRLYVHSLRKSELLAVPEWETTYG